jgi:hypothetical protein
VAVGSDYISAAKQQLFDGKKREFEWSPECVALARQQPCRTYHINVRTDEMMDTTPFFKSWECSRCPISRTHNACCVALVPTSARAAPI